MNLVEVNGAIPVAAACMSDTANAGACNYVSKCVLTFFTAADCADGGSYVPDALIACIKPAVPRILMTRCRLYAST
jgi:hypothetical protein